MNVSESPESPVGPAASGEGWGSRGQLRPPRPNVRCGVGGGSPVRRQVQVTGLLVVRAELVRRGQLLPGPGRGRAGGGPRPSSSGLSRIPSTKEGCGRSSCAAVKPSARALCCLLLMRSRVRGPPVGVCVPDCDDGHPYGSTVPVPARLERFGRVGQWQVPGGRLVGLTLGHAALLSLVDRGYVYVSTPGAWARGPRGGRPGSWLRGLPSGGFPGGLSSPSSRDASSKATPVYHPRG